LAKLETARLMKGMNYPISDICTKTRPDTVISLIDFSENSDYNKNLQMSSDLKNSCKG